MGWRRDIKSEKANNVEGWEDIMWMERGRTQERISVYMYICRRAGKKVRCKREERGNGRWQCRW